MAERTSSPIPQPAYSSMNWCYMRLSAGVEGRKYNYGNSKSKPITIKLNDSKDGLIIINRDENSKSTTYMFSKCSCTIYGAHTTTFMHRKLDVLRNTQHLRSSEEDCKRRILDLQLTQRDHRESIVEFGDNSDPQRHNKSNDKDNFFFSWQCLSIVLDSHNSLDLVVYDQTH